MRFKMTLDTTNLVSTVVLLVVIVIPAIVVPSLAGPTLAVSIGALGARLIVIGLTLVPFVVVAIAAIWAPSGLELTHDEVRVLRRVGAPLSIPLSSIAAVEVGPTPQLRLFGSSGILGSFGIFSASGFGKFRLYGTRRGNYVALRLKEGMPVVVTPDEADHFREVLGHRLAALGTLPTASAP